MLRRRRMRRATIIFLVAVVLLVGFLTNECSTLISLLFENGSAYAISPADLSAPNAEVSSDDRAQLIPKIIHQTYINETIPAQWRAGHKACIDLHPDYEYILWTDEMSRDFIKKEYEWFLETFDAYPFPIERADAIRYFVLHYYGGIYIDLDDGCKRSLDPLLAYPAWVRFTVPTGISNDAMGSIKQHPFFAKVIASLKPYQRNWIMGYITVMYSTGPLFLSVIWKEYLWTERPASDHVKILMPSEYKGNEWSFFDITKGSSWHGKDAQTIFWMGKHWLLLTVSGFAIAGVIGLLLWSCLIGSKKTTTTSGGRGGKLSFWKRITGGNEPSYELVDRMA